MKTKIINLLKMEKLKMNETLAIILLVSFL